MTPPSPSGPARPAPATERIVPAGAFLRRLGESALNFLLPPSCIRCDQPVLRQGHLCATCFSAMTFIAAPQCPRCGLPFESTELDAGPCTACVDAPPVFRQARAPFLYDEGVRRLLLPFKHGDRSTLAQVLAPHMARAGAAMLADRPILVPVPLHRLRLLHRRHNQAALLARALATITGCPTGLDWLRRLRATPPLDDCSAAERRAILNGAFAVRTRCRSVVAGRGVVLIDDVLTSGATANACARALLDAGATSVDVLVVARVPVRHDLRLARSSPSGCGTLRTPGSPWPGGRE